MANKERYELARENVVEFTADIMQSLLKTGYGVNESLEAKKCVIRIYRDIRFSKDKTPYKNNFGVSIPVKGKKLGGPEYYLQIAPAGSFIAGGYWMPEADTLKAIRQEIDYNAANLKKIIDTPEFIKLFGEFRSQDKLKTVPKGYNADNENIGLLKLKSFVAIHQLKDSDLGKKDAATKIAELCSKIYPLNVFLNNAVV